MERARNEPCPNRQPSCVLPRSRLDIGTGWIHVSKCSWAANNSPGSSRRTVNPPETTDEVWTLSNDVEGSRRGGLAPRRYRCSARRRDSRRWHVHVFHRQV